MSRVRWTNVLAFKLAVLINQLQHGFSNFLKKNTANFSVCQWKTLTIGGCICWGFCSLYITIATLTQPLSTPKNQFEITVNGHLQDIVNRGDSLQYLERIYNARKSMEPSNEGHHPDTTSKHNK